MNLAGMFRDAARWVERNPVVAIGAGVAGAVAIGAAAGVAASGVEGVRAIVSGPGPQITDAATRSRVPTTYGTAKQPTMRARWNGALGTALRRMAPLAWPGVPPEAFCGFTAISTGASENTAIAANNRFAEIGLFQTSAGARSTPDETSGPYPAVARTNQENKWLDLHASELVRRLLGGRDATMVHNAWIAAIDDQTAVGLAMLLAHEQSAAQQMRADTRPASLATSWAIGVAFTSFSTGSGGAARALNTWAADAARAGEQDRWSAVFAAAARDARAGVASGGRAGQHGNKFYDLLRTAQKLESGRLLAVSVGGNAAWFPRMSTADQEAVTRAAFA